MEQRLEQEEEDVARTKSIVDRKGEARGQQGEESEEMTEIEQQKTNLQ
jgi:hypothetical protein